MRRGATFNVPIRTVVLHHQAASKLVRCGIGSGITLDATLDAEWREWQAKRAFVEHASTPFDILEPLRLQDGALPHADLHLARMGAAGGAG